MARIYGTSELSAMHFVLNNNDHNHARAGVQEIT